MSSPTRTSRAVAIRLGISGVVSLPVTLLLQRMTARQPYHLALGPEPIVHVGPTIVWEWLVTASAFALVVGLFCLLFAALPSRAFRFVLSVGVAGAVVAVALFFADRLTDLSPYSFLALYPTSILLIGTNAYSHPWYTYVVFAFTAVSNAFLYSLVAFGAWSIWHFTFNVRGAATK